MISDRFYRRTAEVEVFPHVYAEMGEFFSIQLLLKLKSC